MYLLRYIYIHVFWCLLLSMFDRHTVFFSLIVERGTSLVHQKRQTGPMFRFLVSIELKVCHLSVTILFLQINSNQEAKLVTQARTQNIRFENPEKRSEMI